MATAPARCGRPTPANASQARSHISARWRRKNPDKKVVVATHHAPSLQGVAVSQRASRINAAYYTDLHAFIEQRPNIGAWIHGHTHVQTEYAVGQCRVLSNARGYAGRERAALSFEPDRSFDI